MQQDNNQAMFQLLHQLVNKAEKDTMTHKDSQQTKVLDQMQTLIDCIKQQEMLKAQKANEQKEMQMVVDCIVQKMSKTIQTRTNLAQNSQHSFISQQTESVQKILAQAGDERRRVDEVGEMLKQAQFLEAKSGQTTQMPDLISNHNQKLGNTLTNKNQNSMI